MVTLALKYSELDFGVSCGYRNIDKQAELYKSGRTVKGAILTNCDGIRKKSKHNQNPSQAVDIFVSINGKANWESKNYITVNKAFTQAATELGINYVWGVIGE